MVSMLAQAVISLLFVFQKTFAVTQVPLAITTKENEQLDGWLDAESGRALQSILDNIGSNGSYALDAHAGVVVASPSRSNPNYYFTWTRDSSIVFKCMVDAFIAGNMDLQEIIHQYITSQAYIQTLENPSGNFSTGGLGEPKFYANETQFTGSWGRPQADGPALRATSMVAYARWLIENNYHDVVETIVWPVIQNDLSYITQYWNTSAFDLWEEVDSPSFFTTIVQHRALVEGHDLARELGLSCCHCSSQSPQVLCLLQSYWNGSYVLASFSDKRSGIDSSSILGSVHTFDPEADCDDTTFQPCSSRALANHKVVTDAFRSLYPINSGLGKGEAVAVGRYPEDVYFNGNPWYVTTLAAAEQLYDAIHQWRRSGQIKVTNVSLPFFKDIYQPAEIGTYVSSTPRFNAIIFAVKTYADGYMRVAQKYTPCSGMLSEQYHRNNGDPTSASDLTWSYAALLTAISRRNLALPASWGERTAHHVPRICASTSAIGPFQTATIESWPENLTTTSPLPPCPTPTEVSVTFNLIATTTFKETVFIAGSISQLGLWDADAAIPLRADRYADNCHLWYTEISLPAGITFEYKYIRKDAGGKVTWESDPNRSYRVPAKCERIESTKRDSWR